MPQIVRALFQQADIGNSRSSSLNPLQWMLAIVLSATVGCVLAGAPTWFIIVLAVLSCLLVSLSAGAYIYLLRRDPDALRSEHFTLSKMAIEKGLIGDSDAGLFESRRPVRVVQRAPTVLAGHTETDEGSPDAP